MSLEQAIDIISKTVDSASARSKKITNASTRHLLTIEKMSLILDITVNSLLTMSTELPQDKVDQVKMSQSQLDQLMSELSDWVQEQK